MQEVRNKLNPFACRIKKSTNKQQTGTWKVFTTGCLGGGNTNSAPLCPDLAPDAPTRAQGVTSELHKTNPKQSHPASPQGLALELHKTMPRRLVLTGPLHPPAKESLPSCTKIAKKGQFLLVPKGWAWNYIKPSQNGWFPLIPPPPPPPQKELLPSYTKTAKNGQFLLVPKDSILNDTNSAQNGWLSPAPKDSLPSYIRPAQNGRFSLPVHSSTSKPAAPPHPPHLLSPAQAPGLFSRLLLGAILVPVWISTLKQPYYKLRAKGSFYLSQSYSNPTSWHSPKPTAVQPQSSFSFRGSPKKL